MITDDDEDDTGWSGLMLNNNNLITLNNCIYICTKITPF
jgi:hypothetical protein